LRVSLSAAHKENQIVQLIKTLTKIIMKVN
jgi:hypothetical protein